MSRSVQKFRPVLPEHLITHILKLAKDDMVTNPTDSNNVELIGILAPFKAKIDNMALSAAYTTKPKQSLEEKLGMEAAPSPTAAYMLDGVPYNTKEEYWEACYHKVLKSPQTATLREIELANEYRYLHGLMNEEETMLFEQGSFVPFNFYNDPSQAKE